ncbi:ABC transporter permease [Aeromonas cavernicola]|uniref:ABC transporter permease n=1 Tax=Aeromonas cavernicola TaxID=1006623 RepID=A0A2H9U087_9GAMM|nr:FtsX-like permease family protein [Aeromonas cavernicola]PJG57467.1 ABC transporter permease [Aeromonas cavernicola]
MNAWYLAWCNMLRNRRRSLVTVLIAALGCFSVLVACGFALHTYQMLEEGAAREFGHITVTTPELGKRHEEKPMQYGIDHYRPLIRDLASVPHVTELLPKIALSGLISNGDNSIPFVGYGIETDKVLATLGSLITIEQQVPPSTWHEQGALLGSTLAKQLNVQVGDAVTLLAATTEGSMNALDLVVNGIVSTGWQEVDARLVYLSVEHAQQLLLTDRISSFSILLDEMGATATTVAELASTYPAYQFTPWWERSFYYQSVRSLYDRIFGLLGIIIAMLVFFSMSNTLGMAVTERTREIGTLRALGTYPREIVLQFWHEGILIGALGTVIGTGLALLVVVLLPFAGLEMPPPPGRTIGYPLLIKASLPLYLITTLTIITVCGLAAWYVSRKASRKPIVEALTHV